MEVPETAASWAKKCKFTFPVLLDPDGTTTERFAPPGVLPDLPRNQVPIASNLIIDREGRIRFYSLLDSANFDARLVALRARLDELLRGGAGGNPPAVVEIRPPEEITLPPGGSADAQVQVRVKEGFHVQANPASESYLIPLRLDLAADARIRVGEPLYPRGQPYRLQGASSDLSTYEGAFVIRIPLHAAKDAAPGPLRLTGALRYQACDARICLKPASVPVAIPVRIAARDGGS